MLGPIVAPLGVDRDSSSHPPAQRAGRTAGGEGSAYQAGAKQTTVIATAGRRASRLR